MHISSSPWDLVPEILPPVTILDNNLPVVAARPRLEPAGRIDVAEGLVVGLGPDGVGHGIGHELLALNIDLALALAAVAVAPAPAAVGGLVALVALVTLVGPVRLDRGVHVDGDDLDGVLLDLDLPHRLRVVGLDGDGLGQRSGRRRRRGHDDGLARDHRWGDGPRRRADHHGWRPGGRNDRRDARARRYAAVGGRLEIEPLLVLVVPLPARGFIDDRIHDVRFRFRLERGLGEGKSIDDQMCI